MGEKGYGTHAWAVRRKILKETQEAEECVCQSFPAAGGDAGSGAPSSPRARARPGRVGLEQEAEGLRLQEAAAAAGDLQTHPRVTGH